MAKRMYTRTVPLSANHVRVMTPRPVSCFSTRRPIDFRSRPNSPRNDRRHTIAIAATVITRAAAGQPLTRSPMAPFKVRYCRPGNHTPSVRVTSRVEYERGPSVGDRKHTSVSVFVLWPMSVFTSSARIGTINAGELGPIINNRVPPLQK